MFPLASMSRLPLRPTKPPIQWVLTTHPHLVPTSRMSMSNISSPIRERMAVAGQFYFFTLSLLYILTKYMERGIYTSKKLIINLYNKLIL
jgi:hypothetical protein